MRMMVMAVVAVLMSGPALADLVKVKDQQHFVQIVNGKTLTRPFVKLNVLPDGQIAGRGARWGCRGHVVLAERLFLSRFVLGR
ncbi:MAG: hypothetical protein AAGK77_00795 [Pseudomonadota bacterium]